MPDKCPRCGVVFTFWSPKRDVYRDVLGRVHTPGGMDCLRRQVAALREELRVARLQYETLRAAVVDASEAPARAREWMRRHNITFTDLDDHWQKVGFSLYSDLVEISERAKAALEVCQDAAAD